ncbi:MAG TPA: RNA polymerase sigma factor SigJ [Segeticoccus sp.]|uniref:RNA polymerase sigma factor SigJ n=1 Tax=Segeticoccus sp. TaxID=2706531 RepID=UPI002D8005B3|nr:RNA polymerase sigma factor SigJ [Segeticoccus sp.]HET8601997.1 RNA polymerase sigma factor SigJ [Segeticoccus sp.]
MPSLADASSSPAAPVQQAAGAEAAGAEADGVQAAGAEADGVEADGALERRELDRLAEEFATWRRQLVGAAYRILGSVTDAEDVVQEVWLRWVDVDREQVRNRRAYLLTTTTRLALNHVRSRQRRRESYVGPWLPEPLPGDALGLEPELASTSAARDLGDGPAAVELAESVSMAMLVVLETLSPLERAAFVLHEVFGVPFDEVGEALGRSPAAARQLASRARSHVQARRPRQLVDRARHRQVTERFLEAAQNGDLDGLLATMAPDVVLVSDGGGVRRAALRPIVGAEKAVRWLLAVSEKPEVAGYTAGVVELNGEPALALWVGDVLDTVAFLTVEERGITGVQAIRNPEKLAHLGHLAPATTT